MNLEKRRQGIFLGEKADAERGYIEEQFNLSGHYKITLNTDVSNAADFQINSIKVDVFPWSGYYFKGVPIRIKVIPKHGQKFITWSDPNFGNSDEIIHDFDKDIELIAFFDETVSNKTIVINEFMYNAPDESDSKDWIELLNYGDETVDLSSWVLSDDNDDHIYVIPDGTIIGANELLVICRDSESFSEIHDIKNNIGDIDFGFGTSDAIRLFDSNYELIDFVEYTSEFPWYPEANGTGLSLELIDPNYDNSLPSSWKLTNIDNGTPGEKNSVSDTNTIPDDSDYIYYPHPADEYIRLELKDPAKTTNIILSDAKGRIMADYLNYIGSITKLTNGFHIQVAEFAAGVYYLMLLDSETKKEVIPILIER